MQVLNGGIANSSTSCEWATGCVAPHANEWLAAVAEWQLSGSTITCHHTDTYLKKSELQSSELPASEKLGVTVGTAIQLQTVPAGPVDGYWLISCANGTVCAGQPRKELAKATIPARMLGQVQQQYLMIGDSISLGYLPYVTAALGTVVSVKHNAGNAGNANNIAHRLHCYLQAAGSPLDVVTFNAGIHDLARGQEWLSLLDYTSLIANISRVLKGASKRAIFVTTTPVPTNSSNAALPSCPEGIIDSDVQRYNHAGIQAATAAGLEVLDLYALVIARCGRGYSSCTLQEPNNPHFLTAGWQLLGNAVARKVVNPP